MTCKVIYQMFLIAENYPMEQKRQENFAPCLPVIVV